MQRKGCLAAGFGAEDFQHPAARNADAAEGDVQAQRAGGNAVHIGLGIAVELHDGALAELLFDLLNGAVECRIACGIVGSRFSSRDFIDPRFG